MSDDSNGARNAGNGEDTVSLIDLVAVFLRHRRLIIISTLCATLLALVGYLFYPIYVLDKTERELVVEANMILRCSSSFIGILSQEDGGNFIMQSLRDPANILTALQAAGYEEIDRTDIRNAADVDKAIFVVRRRVIENKTKDGRALKESSRIFLVTLDKGVISVLYKNGDADKAKAFLQTLVGIVEKDLRSFIEPNAKGIIESYERLLHVETQTDVVSMSIVQGSQSYAIAKGFIEGTAFPLVVLRKPYVLVPEISIEAIRKDYLKTCVIAVLAVFFLSIFAAFVFQYIDTVRKDPEAMGKIRDALGKSKK